MIVPWNEIEMIARANLTRIPEYEYLGIRLSNPKKFSEIMPKFTRIQDKFHLGCMTSELDGSLNDICAHIRALQNAEKISVVFKE